VSVGSSHHVIGIEIESEFAFISTSNKGEKMHFFPPFKEQLDLLRLLCVRSQHEGKKRYRGQGHHAG